MARSSEYKHWMQRIDITDTAKDLELSFPGLFYLRTDGIYDIGKAKNIYTETYADSDDLRVFLPNGGVYTNEATKITMHFLATGSNSAQRLALVRIFCEYVRQGIHRYWDDARNLEFDFIVTDEIKVSDERWHGTTPYVEISVPMQNLKGKARVHS